MGHMLSVARRVASISQPLKPARWRNIAVLKSGRRIPGIVLHPSREIALAAVAHAEILWAARASMGVQVIILANGSFLWTEYSHCEQAES
jgi:hypothetical protein